MIKNFKQFEDVYYPDTTIYETEDDRDERLTKLAEQFMDEEVGLDLVNVGSYHGRISVNYKKGLGRKDFSDRARQQARDEWRESAQSLIEELSRNGENGYELSMSSENGFEIRNYGEVSKRVKSYSKYPFGG